MNIGDLVYLKKFTKNIKFIIQKIIKDIAVISAIDYRLILDAPLKDLQYLSSTNFNKAVYDKNCDNLTAHIIKSNSSNSKILHIDGEKMYLSDSLKQYKSMGVNVMGFNIKEEQQPSLILCLLKKYNPNIVVITGHDSLYKDKKNSKNLNDYKNSKYFIESIKAARTYNDNYDNLVIIAGGCKSFHEALLKAGANFASSPDRILINVLDPVNIACLLAKTPKDKYLNINDLYKILNLEPGSFDGIRTRGQSIIEK